MREIKHGDVFRNESDDNKIRIVIRSMGYWIICCDFGFVHYCMSYREVKKYINDRISGEHVDKYIFQYNLFTENV